MLFADGGNASVSREVGLHPPNLVNEDGENHPNALIPFCAYQTKMLGQRVQTLNNRSFIACSQFKPTILEGQLCYSLDVKTDVKMKSGAGKGNGLLLIIDADSTGQKENAKVARDIDHEITTLNLLETNTDTQVPKIYMNTLERYETFQTGSFALSSLKKMTGTDTYIANKNKDCSVETFEDCQARRYLEEVEKQCRCVPWALATGNTVKVTNYCIIRLYIRVSPSFRHTASPILPIVPRES